MFKDVPEEDVELLDEKAGWVDAFRIYVDFLNLVWKTQQDGGGAFERSRKIPLEKRRLR